jgi:hypothetical protein
VRDDSTSDVRKVGERGIKREGREDFCSLPFLIALGALAVSQQRPPMR